MTKETETLINSIEELKNISMRQFHAIGDLIEQVKNSVVLADVVGQSEQLVCDDCGYEINPAGICINMNCSTNESH